VEESDSSGDCVKHAGSLTPRVALQEVQNHAGDPNIPPPVRAHWLDDRAHILWNRFFRRDPTPSDRQALKEREKAKYTIAVQDASDPNFLSSSSDLSGRNRQRGPH